MTIERNRTTNVSVRQQVMRTLSMATSCELTEAIAKHWPQHGARDLKHVECGLVMLRGQIGGDGAAFNVGEATVTRAVVELPTGERGYGHVLGRDVAHAHAAAVLDALCQHPLHSNRVKCLVLDPIATRLSRERADVSTATAATRVEFFTLVRGEA